MKTPLKENIMRVSTNFALPLSAVLFGLLLVPRAALAQTADCPIEPASNVPLGDGGVLAGTNCTLYTDGDVDSFVFNGTNGDTYQLAVAINGAAQFGPNFCLTLYDPSAKQIFSGCSDTANLAFSVVTDQTLTATGRYTIDVTEPSTGKLNYAVSLERLYPFPPNAQQVTLATVVAGDVTGDHCCECDLLRVWGKRVETFQRHRVVELASRRLSYINGIAPSCSQRLVGHDREREVGSVATTGEDLLRTGVVECQAEVRAELSGAVYRHSKLVGVPVRSIEHKGIDISVGVEGAVGTCEDPAGD